MAIEVGGYQIIFAIPRYNYTSYTDWYRLIAAGEFEAVFFDQIDLSKENIYICSPINGEFRPHLANERAKGNIQAKIVWANLERPVEGELDPKGVHAGTDLLEDFTDMTWVFCRSWHKALCDKLPSKASRIYYTPLGSEKGIGQLNIDHSKSYMWAHMSYGSPRRGPLIGWLENFATAAPNAFPPERDEILRKTAILVNIHQDNHKFLEPLRIALAAANGMALISEMLDDPYPLQPDKDFVQVPKDGLMDALKTLWGQQQNLKTMGLNLHNRLCVEFRFQTNVIKAVKECFGLNS